MHEMYLVVTLNPKGKVTLVDFKEPNKYFHEERTEWEINDLTLHFWYFKAVLQHGGPTTNTWLLFSLEPADAAVDKLLTNFGESYRAEHPEALVENVPADEESESKGERTLILERIGDAYIDYALHQRQYIYDNKVTTFDAAAHLVKDKGMMSLLIDEVLPARIEARKEAGGYLLEQGQREWTGEA